MSRSHTCTIIYTNNSTQHVTTKYNYSDTVTKALMLPGRILQLSSPSNSSGFTTPPQRLEGIFKWGPGPCTMAIRPQAAHEDAGPCHPPIPRALQWWPYHIPSYPNWRQEFGEKVKRINESSRRTLEVLQLGSLGSWSGVRGGFLKKDSVGQHFNLISILAKHQETR